MRVFLYDAVIDQRYEVMAQRKRHTGFFPWIDPQDHSKGFKLNFSEVTYVEVASTPEGYKQVEFVRYVILNWLWTMTTPKVFISPQMA